MPKVTYDSAGERQRENYWSRNRKMFDEIDEAAERRHPERILVVVGMGHKYFLDEITKKRGYEWVDPQRYLEPGP